MANLLLLGLGMPWQERSVMTCRKEFVLLASQAEGCNLSELSRRFKISRKTAYKWLRRYRKGGEEALANRTTKPHHSPFETPAEVQQTVIELRQAHPAWGGRKLHRRLLDLGVKSVPSPSTITHILHRVGLINPEISEAVRPPHRFEHPHPNDLWQADFKGWFYAGKARCFPLTILDDHSRYSLAVHACKGESRENVQPVFENVFRTYGLPVAMTMDNGCPWGASNQRFTHFAAWLIRLGIRVSHSRPHHPQTQGKDERFHRTLKTELLHNRAFHSLEQCQSAFDSWRDMYNTERPHEALDMFTPVTRYQVSPRTFPDKLPPIEYSSQDIVRYVKANGLIKFKGGLFRVGTAFHHHPVALRFTLSDGIWDVYFCHQKIATIDEDAPEYRYC